MGKADNRSSPTLYLKYRKYSSILNRKNQSTSVPDRKTLETTSLPKGKKNLKDKALRKLSCNST